MEINKKIYSVALVSVALILFLIFVSSMASAASSSTITETRITTNGTASNPDIYGDKIVWQDNRAGNWDVYIYDLSAKKEIHTTNTTNQIAPSIYGSRVVWEDERNGGHDIYMEDLSTKTQTRISKSGEAHNPAIYGNKIVWQDERDGNWDIYMYYLSTSKEYQITHNLSDQTEPDIYEDRIVWVEDGTIYMYNISTSTETRITSYFWGSDNGSGETGDLNYVPFIYGDRVVSSAETITGNYLIKLYNLSTSTEQVIGEYDADSSSPAIYGSRIVWEDGRKSSPPSWNRDIYMYDLSTSRETQITTNESNQGDPAIYGDRIVWRDDRNVIQNDGTKYDIYMGTLSESEPTPVPPVANFAASPASGNAPLSVKFIDKSSGSPTSWKWTFGDGASSTLKNPAHKYTKAGKYTVNLTVKNAAGSSTKTIKNYINVKLPAQKPVAAFSVSPTSGNIPLKVTFTDKSTGSPTSWKWSFGDGKTSTVKNPTNTYTKAGKYTVSLTVKNAAGSSIKTIKNYIVANELKAPVAAFSASPTSGKAPLKVQFTDKSTNSPTSWKWSFGDKTYSTSKNPAHTYSKAGKYTVSLTVKNAKGSNAKTMSNYITVKK